MSRRLAATGLSLLALVQSPVPLHSQVPAVAIHRLSVDSIELKLRQPSYVVLVQRLPNERPRVIYPGDSDEWVLSPAGLLTLSFDAPFPGEWLTKASVEPQCIVTSRVVRSWDAARGLTSGPTQAACGPLMRSKADPQRALGVGYGPWEAWAAPLYDPRMAGKRYLVAVVLDSSGGPPWKSPGSAVFSAETTPLQAAVAAGSLAPRAGRDPFAWQAAILIPR